MASSLSFDEEVEDQGLSSHNTLYGLDLLPVEPDLYSDWEEDSDRSGGVALIPFTAGTALADCGEHP